MLQFTCVLRPAADVQLLGQKNTKFYEFSANEIFLLNIQKVVLNLTKYHVNMLQRTLWQTKGPCITRSLHIGYNGYTMDGKKFEQFPESLEWIVLGKKSLFPVHCGIYKERDVWFLQLTTFH